LVGAFANAATKPAGKTANTASKARLRGDHISGTDRAPVREIECCGVTATVIVK
jgi:hypothetical protein